MGNRLAVHVCPNEDGTLWCVRLAGREKPLKTGLAFAEALKVRKPTVLEFVVDGSQLAPPFRKDALALPSRFLPKYAHLDHHNWQTDYDMQ